MYIYMSVTTTLYICIIYIYIYIYIYSEYIYIYIQLHKVFADMLSTLLVDAFITYLHSLIKCPYFTLYVCRTK